MAKQMLVDDLVNAVRSLLDEDNESHIDTEKDILPAINRAQDAATDLVAQKYENVLLTSINMVTQNGVQSYELPTGIFEDRLEKVDLIYSSGITNFIPITRKSYRDSSAYDATITGATYPLYYDIVENNLRLVPTPQSTYNLRLWYLKAPPLLTLSQGRVTNINTAGNYFYVDEVGENVSTDIDSLNSFISVISGTTGRVKATFQVKSINGQKIEIKTAFDYGRTTVYGLPLSNDVTTTNIALDDYICSAKGSCGLYMMQPFFNYIVQYAVADIKGIKLNEENQTMVIALDKAEKRLERLWVSRETDKIVKKKSRLWR